jgi:ABC-type sugar transport system ATPase subunit
MDEVVALEGIEKSFGGVKVLHDVNLRFRRGEVHAVIGENGAGKSSVGKIIGGYYSADRGALRVFGRQVPHWSPRAALQAGITMIHQELQLVPEMTVAQNVFLGIEENRAGILTGSESARFAELDRRCGFGLAPNGRVATLRIADRQKVEIMRAIARDARVIIMDEPTSSLTADETERLHRVIGWLKADGRTVVYVTHFLEHVLAHSDRVSIMRDGRVVRTSETAVESKASLVEAMLGEPADVAFPERPPTPSPEIAPVLEVAGLTTQTGVTDVSLVVRPGEIVGLIGLVGSGRSEIARAIFGADAVTAGSIAIAGERYEAPTPARSVRNGLALVPEDRRKQGLDMTQRVRTNITLPHLGLVSRFGVVQLGEERRRVLRLIEHFNILPPRVDGAVAYFSGGNQQKVLLSKWLFGEPRLVILDEPSRGVDIGARRRIHDFVVELARAGAGVLLISSELEEVIALSHRAYLVRSGTIIDEVETTTLTADAALYRLFRVEPAAGNAAGAA